jgi:hypothetical protein
VIPAVRIVSIPLDFFGRDRNVLSVFSALCIDVAVDIPDLGRVAVRLIATGGVRVIRHTPRRIEFFVQGNILQWMVPRGVIFCVLCVGRYRQRAAKTAAQEIFEETFALRVHCEISPLLGPEFQKIVAPHSVSSGLQSAQPTTIVRSTDPGAVSALLRTESGSPGVVPDEPEFSLTDRATIGCAVRKTLRIATHVFLLLVLSGLGWYSLSVRHRIAVRLGGSGPLSQLYVGKPAA